MKVYIVSPRSPEDFAVDKTALHTCNFVVSRKEAERALAGQAEVFPSHSFYLYEVELGEPVAIANPLKA